MMNGGTETMLKAWLAAPEKRRTEALAVLNGSGGGVGYSPQVVRYSEAAKRLSVTVRSLRYGMARAGIKPVKFVGRTRGFGIKADDLKKLLEDSL